MKILENHQKILVTLLACPQGLFKVGLAGALRIPEHQVSGPLEELFQHSFVEVRRDHETAWTAGSADSELPGAWSCRYRLTEIGKQAARVCGNR